MTWRIYQQMICAYRNPDRAAGTHAMSTLIDDLSTGLGVELITLGRTLKRSAAAVPPTSPVHGQRPDRDGQRPDRDGERPPRVPTRQRPGLSQPHPLHRPAACSNATGSGPDYTLDCEEPAKGDA